MLNSYHHDHVTIMYLLNLVMLLWHEIIPAFTEYTGCILFRDIYNGYHFTQVNTLMFLDIIIAFHCTCNLIILQQSYMYSTEQAQCIPSGLSDHNISCLP